MERHPSKVRRGDEVTEPTPAPEGLTPDPTLVVTGAAGWLGQNLLRTTRPDRERIRALAQDEGQAALLAVLGPNVEPVVGDVRDPVAVARLFDGLDAPTVVHTAAVIHPTDGVRQMFDVNVGGTEVVLDQARRSGARRVVHISSTSPFGANPHPGERFTEDSPRNPFVGYGGSKHEAELLVERAHARGDVETVILRAPWFYGPWQPERQARFFAGLRRGRFPLVGDGSNRRSMVYTGHLVQGVLRAEAVEAAAGRDYWIADAEPYRVADVYRTVKEALAAEGLEPVGYQPRLPRLAGVVAEGLDRAAQSRGAYVQALHVLGEMKDEIAVDVTRARTELGYDPATTLLDGMRTSIRWCLEHGQAL
ncbi:NAD(P)-dependent oxidoreductase [Iamia majanohamensis]|uniref:NAD(P)-dependent oxidoreductase n=1 Tax=Iamia majanohamensis TaxID=467976 RepID=A0AAF0BTB9_9ACTN|nr:NAD(P)-dependent oxidoreductase [Iamia majanohamensis]WCO66577.1 NAD(P)-dependent oxidoreductase [Iamia majanohamensis]